MEELDQVSKYYDEIIMGQEVNHAPVLFHGTSQGQRIMKFFNNILVLIFDEEVLLRRRSNGILSKLIKVEAECTLTVQDKIILLSKALTFCYETFGFAPSALEKMLVKKVEEMKHAVIAQLN